jgi:hypothetical protein
MKDKCKELVLGPIDPATAFQAVEDDYGHVAEVISPKMAKEIVRRWNAHAALVAVLKECARQTDESGWPVMNAANRDLITEALKLAGEVTDPSPIEPTPDWVKF